MNKADLGIQEKVDAGMNADITPEKDMNQTMRHSNGNDTAENSMHESEGSEVGGDNRNIL